MLKSTAKLLACLAIAVSTTACTEGTSTGSTTQSVNSAPVRTTGKTAQEISLEKSVQALNQQTKDIIVRNTVEGALVGAAVGCGLVLLMGGDENDCARGALVGAVAGGVGGNAVGQQAAQKNNELVKQDAILANLKGINGKLVGVQADLAAVLKSQNSEISSLRRQLSSNQISKSQYDSRVNAINSNRQAVSSGLLSAEKNVAGSRAQLASFEKEGGKPLSSLKAAAVSTEQRLASLRGTVALIGGN